MDLDAGLPVIWRFWASIAAEAGVASWVIRLSFNKMNRISVWSLQQQCRLRAGFSGQRRAETSPEGCSSDLKVVVQNKFIGEISPR